MPNFSIKILFFTISIIGILCIPFLSYKLIPDNISPVLKVSFSWPNTSQYIIEREVTSRFEGIFSSVKDVKKIISKSYAGYGEIFIEFNNKTDIDRVRFQLSTLIRQIYPNLPKGITYPKVLKQRYYDQDVRFLSYSIIEKKGNSNISQFIDKILTPRINQIKNVSSIKYDGIPSYYYEVKYNSKEINLLNISINEIKLSLIHSLEKKNLGTFISTNKTYSEEFSIILNDSFSIEELYNLPLKKVKSKIIRLKDVASIIKKKREPINLFRINGQKSISFSIVADKNANQIKLANTIKREIQNLDKEYSNYNFILTNDKTIHLKKELGSIFFRTLMSFVFLLFFTAFVYQSSRYVFVLFFSLIVILLVSFIFFKVFEIGIHIYSLMAIAISIGFAIDNTIISIDHYLRNKNRKIVLPIFAATITTITPLFLIVFLEDSIRINLIDFSWTLVIILTSSLLVSFFFTPSIIQSNTPKRNLLKIRKLFLLVGYYRKIILFLTRYRIIIGVVLIFLFGTPLFLLPKNIEGNSFWTDAYNLSIGSDYYTNYVRPKTDKYFGGVLKLFFENSLDDDFIQNPKRPKVSMRIKTPFGSTINYIDTICKKIENSLNLNLSLGIDFFQTTIYDKRSAQIDVFFKADTSLDFLYDLKGFLEKESLNMSGVDFTIYGVGKPFGTFSDESYSSSIIFMGYDYKKLHSYAEMVSKKIIKNNRIKNTVLQSEQSWFYHNKKKYTLQGIDLVSRNVLKDFYDNFSLKEIGNYKIGKGKIPIKLISNTKEKKSAYIILNTQFLANDSIRYKPKFDVKLDLKSVPDKIVKSNQEYQLVLQYDFKGTKKHNKIVKKDIINRFKKYFAPGFKLKDGDIVPLDDKSKTLFLPILVCLFMIFSICAILLESFMKSLLIVSMIPITLIGLFFSLYYMEIGFNSGVYGGLILLIGILVNSAIFIINEYTNYNKKFNSEKSYFKAFNQKIIPITITILSTVVGLIPFLISDSENNFWYPFAVTICLGLLFSLFTLIFILPIYLVSNNKYDSILSK
ncbi:hypothetical protein ATO12_17240 [Aquimarina atlantica]|uniref:Multidrug transporter n=1 Tax=Aquimarina atlantica TaxID=1317122 RepID=A0A023BUK0_9FLAO|nr:efflux RND transporter permease subunit [Aquimarina atlantica]EZH73681.1 hypothetical protein ATO12_17240 [Aquimarina atlantica]